MNFEWNETKLDSFCQKMENIINNLSDGALSGIKKASESTQELAIKKVRGKSDKTMIIIEIDNDKLESKIHTDKEKFSHASFMEYGTGIYAEREHIGKTKVFINSGYRYWYVPMTLVNLHLQEDRLLILKDGTVLQRTYAQQPKPFMRPAAFENRKNNVEIVKEEVKKSIDEVI